jgi:general secretion pathway protein I
MSGGRPQGFTLLEVLVALAVFSLAALAMLRLQGAGIATVAHLDERLAAQITAHNLAVEADVAVPAPAFGTMSGTVRNAGRDFGYALEVARTPDPGLMRITVSVLGPDGGVLARELVVRPAT